jgi:glycine hydroxymethyltransferase
VGFADVITSTTHKTLRGPRGGMILTTAKHASAIDKAVFPGLQGGPHNSAIAGLAVAAHEALEPGFKVYAKQIVDNAKALADALLSRGVSLVTGGTDNHLILADLTSKNVSGKKAAIALEAAGIVCNYNSVPFDKRKPFDPSGIRIGTPATTSRGMKEAEMRLIGGWMADVIEAPEDTKVLDRVRGEVLAMCAQFPAPGLSR